MRDVYTTANMSVRDLQLIVDTADSGTTIHLGAGTYTFDRTLVIDRSDISLVGAGGDRTTIVADKSMASDPVIQLGHDIFRPIVLDKSKITTAAAEGDTLLKLESGHGLQAGDYIYVTEKNTKELFTAIGDELWQKDSDLRTVLLKVESITGNTVTFDTPLPFDFDPAITTVEHRDIIERNTLSGFTVQGSWGDADPGNFSNTLGTANGATAILVAGTADATLTDIKVLDSASNGITVAASTHLNMNDITIDGAADKGDGGNGYGVWIRDVYDSTFSDLTITDTRHAVVFASYTSAVGNTVDVTFTNRDINFHGGLDKSNTVTVGESIRTGAESSYMAASVFFNTGTTYGAPTDKDANTVTFGHVVGTVRTDDVTAASGGSIMYLQGGADKAVTGAGNDYVDMGTGHDLVMASGGNDTLFGGSGTDTLIFADREATYGLKWDGQTLIVTHGSDTTRASLFEKLVFADRQYDFSKVAEHASTLPSVEDEVKPPSTPAPAPTPGPIAAPTPAPEPAPAPDAAPTPAPTPAPAPAHAPDAAPTPAPEPAPATAPDTAPTPAPDSVTTPAPEPSPLPESQPAPVPAPSVVVNVQEPVAASYNVIIGIAGDEKISGSKGNDLLSGMAGNDILSGRDGNDYLKGGAGNDVLLGGSGADILDGGVGEDRAQYSDAKAGVNADLLFSHLNKGFAAGDTYISIENLTGSKLGDYLGGTEGDNYLSGLSGNDKIYGRSGDDRIYGGDGNDTLNGGGGDDLLKGGKGADVLKFDGAFGDDVVTDFNTNQLGEKIDLRDVEGISSYSDLMSHHISQVGRHTVIDDGDGNTITLLKVDMDDLGTNDFMF